MQARRNPLECPYHGRAEPPIGISYHLEVLTCSQSFVTIIKTQAFGLLLKYFLLLSSSKVFHTVVYLMNHPVML